MQTRDIIVIGSSLGGIEALSRLVSGLPPSLPAAVFVVQHQSEHSPGNLATILEGSGPLPGVTAEDGMEPLAGRIHVAPPNRHLLLSEEGIRVSYGPRENRSRPAIDPLFRTAAVYYRSRVIGVILTGLLGDGAAGLLAVSRCGGVAVVQLPDDAAHPEMPSRALTVVPDAHQAPLEGIAALLARLAGEPAPPPPPVPRTLSLDANLTIRAMSNDVRTQPQGESTDFTCPECHGAIWKEEAGGVPRYRCRIGHAYSEDAFVAAKDDAVEEALWIALQTLEERAQMLETMAADDRRRGWERSAETFVIRAREARGHAQRLRDVVERLAAVS